MKTKSICKNQWQKKERKKALYKQTALDKAANSTKKASIIYSIIYKSIKIGIQS